MQKAQEDTLRLESAPQDQEALAAVFRAFHTIKGGAPFLEADHLVEWAHDLEDLLDKLRSHSLPVTPERIDAILGGMDVIESMLEELAGEQSPGPGPVEMSRTIRMLAGEGPAAPAGDGGGAKQPFPIPMADGARPDTRAVRVHMRILQQRQFSEMFRRTAQVATGNDKAVEFLRNSERNWQRSVEGEEAEGLTILRQLVNTVVRLQEGIAEQEYVVTNGRIEAALSERTGAPLMRVSHEMGLAVAKVRDAIWKYRGELEEVLHESRAGV